MAPTSQQYAELTHLLDQFKGNEISLARLESFCAQTDLDLYLEDKLFVWLMDALHDRSILLSDAGSQIDPELPTDNATVEDIQQDIEAIVSLQENEEDRLLNEAETKQLLVAVKEGIAAMEELEREPDSPHREELELLVLKKTEAETTLLTRNRGLVKSISLQFQSSLHSLTMLDLEQEGNMGFLRAIGKFDLNRNTRLSTYAVYWIRQAIQQAIASQDLTIRLPVHKRNEIRQYRAAVEELRDAAGREPTIREIALRLLEAEEGNQEHLARLRDQTQKVRPLDREVLHRMEEHVKQLQSYRQQYPTSLDQYMDVDEPDRYEILTDENVLSPENLMLKKDLIGNVEELVSGLKEPEQTVMRLRFGFGGRRPLKYSEIAEVLNQNPDMVNLNNTQLYTGAKVKNFEALARRSLSRQQKANNLSPDD